MIKVGDRVRHYAYGEGEVVTTREEVGELTVAFEKEFEVLTGSIIDTDYHFEDNRQLKKTRFIQVHHLEVNKIRSFLLKDRSPNCHSCKKLISTNTHKKCSECGWVLCDCGSCGCNYVFKNN
ncbi:hypothetical protein [Virgibacillus halodenitrificans]|uniref:hypothetical protein n=1 Tax=Virgibacillus halodenitrificans TaxID=1482 RepID=UPI002DB7A0EB|nr:hypothetical protein [Virgibacillus halodenitrificans]MEC2158006.1 hypothetical protein [Virgibacillus halodenitrificans]